MPRLRTRIATALISTAVIGLELALMRALSLRFWHHFAYMVISVALLGFGASGTALTLARRKIAGAEVKCISGLLAVFALSIPLVIFAYGRIPVDVQFLAWNVPKELVRIALLELLIFIPFFLSGAVIGIVLMDKPENIGGHYAANLAGSAIGAVLSILLMYVLNAHHLMVAMAAVGYVACLVITPWRHLCSCVLTVVAGAALAASISLCPSEAVMSQYKMLPLLKSMPSTKVIYGDHGPLGRIDVVAGPAIHHAPGLSLQYTDPIPPHVLLIVDGDQTSAVYDCREMADRRFLDFTTAAAAYLFHEAPAVLVMGAGGGSDIELALYRQSPRIVALEMNRQIIRALQGPLAAKCGDLLSRPEVLVVNEEARGFLASSREKFDVVQLPAMEAFGASGAGLFSTQESFVYTVESVSSMIDHLRAGGVLCLTLWARTPPRDGLRAFNMVAEVLRRRGLAPADRIAMIRSWITVTILVFPGGVTDEGAVRIRDFCDARSFDICWLPEMKMEEANRFHILDRPYYFEGAVALLGQGRREFLDAYLFRLDAPTDDKPFFFNFFRLRSLPAIKAQVGGRMPAFLELGYLMLLAALAQTTIAGAILILLPLVPVVRTIRGVRRKGAVFTYFLTLGAGFMILEMGFLQKLVLYLGHPIYSAATVIAGFLFFAGLGSLLSQRSRSSPERRAAAAAGVVIIISLIFAVSSDKWLGLTQRAPMWARFAIAAFSIAPLALAMGHMFPLGLKKLSIAAPAAVPWAWAVNGAASVTATIAAPVIAMSFGFSRVVVAAVVCYAVAALTLFFFPKSAQRSSVQPRLMIAKDNNR